PRRPPTQPAGQDPKARPARPADEVVASRRAQPGASRRGREEASGGPSPPEVDRDAGEDDGDVEGEGLGLSDEVVAAPTERRHPEEAGDDGVAPASIGAFSGGVATAQDEHGED